ncbi:EF-P beta-lysylation protein EpmB [Nevskia ramosa]|uniref:EF-P beta-lysylation protein EpmB n=1 Tax=Nevskia ramosa TaxID=64002 RepID=UPI0003B7193D|nr:EF-P beta-lysylation protein EpmB [Nevskia ramosa]
MDDGLSPTLNRPRWQALLADAITRPADLLAALGIDAAHPALAAEHLHDFPIRVPRSFVARMRPGDPNDPLFLQIWPRPAEADEVPGYGVDAVGDMAKLKGGGLIHKYRGRALVIATGACAVNCRYCFRRHFPYGDAMAARGQWRETLAELDADHSIEEVILSGGDPLALSDDKLAVFADALDTRPWIRRLRLHTRVPVVLPERVDGALLRWLTASRLQKIIVLHANHGNEIDDSVIAACVALRSTGAQLLNQAVLLRGVNDTTDAQAELSERLLAAGVLPYYLHVLDRVAGAAHFDVSELTAQTIMRELAARLPGYLVPRLVREIAGEPAKTQLPW